MKRSLKCQSHEVEMLDWPQIGVHRYSYSDHDMLNSDLHTPILQRQDRTYTHQPILYRPTNKSKEDRYVIFIYISLKNCVNRDTSIQSNNLSRVDGTNLKLILYLILYAPAPSSCPMPERLASKSWTRPDSITSSVRGNFRAHAMVTMCRALREQFL